jgi:hypothetical protein
VTGLLGGLAWVLRSLVLGAASAGDAAYWVGFVLLAVALAATGAGLVTARWLQVLVGAALPVLVWSVLEVVRGGGTAVEGVVGLVVAVLCALGLVGARGSRRGGPRGRAGSHAR